MHCQIARSIGVTAETGDELCQFGHAKAHAVFGRRQIGGRRSKTKGADSSGCGVFPLQVLSQSVVASVRTATVSQVCPLERNGATHLG